MYSISSSRTLHTQELKLIVALDVCCDNRIDISVAHDTRNDL